MARSWRLRRGTAAEWTAANPVLGDGEFGYETDTGNLKIGDGLTAWAGRSYLPTTDSVVNAPVAVNVRKYAVRPDRTAAQNDTGLAQLFVDHPAGVTVAFPDQGTYQLSAPLPSRDNLGIVGNGWGTVLSWTAGSMLAPTSTISGFRLSNVAAETASGASHLIDLGTAGGMTFARFENADLRARNINKSIVFMNGGTNFFGNAFEHCKMWRQPTHAVPAFDLNSTGAGINTCRWRGGWWHSQGCTTSPFFRAEVISGVSYVSKMTFEDVIGEQNYGGLIHIYSANATRVSNVVDHDGTDTYTDDLFKFGNTAGPTSRGLVFRSSGSAGVATFAAGKVHLRDDGLYSDLGRVVNGGVAGTLGGGTTGRVIDHGGGRASAVRTTTTNTTAALADDVILVNSTIARTITLPDPTALLSSGSIPVGRTWTVKNINTAAATVASSGTATIDGAASISLAQWARATLVTDGTNWFQV